MTLKSTRNIVLAGFAAVTLGAFGAASATAQSYYDDQDSITVTAPHRWVSGRSAIGAPIETTTSTSVVNYRDLDLRTDEGRGVLMARVKMAAYHACNEVDRAAPMDGTPDRSSCEADAVSRAGGQVDEAIYAAGG